VHGGVVGSETVLVVAVVDGDLDRDGGVNQTDDGGRDTDEVGVAAVGGTGESKAKVSKCLVSVIWTPLRMGM